MVLLSVVKTYVAHMLKHSTCCTFTASGVVVVVIRPWHPWAVVVVVGKNGKLTTLSLLDPSSHL